MKKGQLLGSARDRAPKRKQGKYAFGWVSMTQLYRDIGEAHRRWLADKAMLPLGSPATATRGHPPCQKSIAALAAWRAAGSPPRSLKAFCAEHGANYYTTVNRRIREDAAERREVA